MVSFVRRWWREALLVLMLCYNAGETWYYHGRVSELESELSEAAQPPVGLLSSVSAVDDTMKVYVCLSSGARRYHHMPTCKGLSSCRAGVVAVDRSAAESRGMTPCRVCCRVHLVR